jgi:uncharacterized protein (DUF1015 family)
VWTGIEPHLAGDPWGEVTDAEGTVHRVWRISDPSVHEAVTAALRDAELLIADGHHRYETARIYADEIGGEGAHRYTLMCLVSLEDPGLTIFGTHRMLAGFDPNRLDAGIREHFDVLEVDEDDVDPALVEGVGVFGFIDGERRLRLRLREPGALDAALPDRSAAYRRLDAVILEELILKAALGMSDADIEGKRGLGYAKGLEQAARLVEAGDYDGGFILRPTPVSQVREVAAAGETMPPKSTFFFPKLLTGIAFNPLS